LQTFDSATRSSAVHARLHFEMHLAEELSPMIDVCCC
jgi:hypothetical protein